VVWSAGESEAKCPGCAESFTGGDAEMAAVMLWDHIRGDGPSGLGYVTGRCYGAVMRKVGKMANL